MLEPEVCKARRQKFTEFGSQGSQRSWHLRIVETRSQFVARSDVDLDLPRFLPIRRNLQDRGTTQAAMGDQHLLAELLPVARTADFAGNAPHIPPPTPLTS